MIYLTKKIQWLVVLLTVASLFLSACGSDEDDADLEEDAAATIDVPQAYVFDSRFVEGESSVAYSGQVVRNLLLQDLKATTDSVGKDGARPIAVSDMLKLYEYDDALNLKTLTTTGGLAASESHYSALSTGKNLVGKISDEPVIGYGRTADDLVREWFEMIADNSQDSDKLGTPMAYTTDTACLNATIVKQETVPTPIPQWNTHGMKPSATSVPLATISATPTSNLQAASMISLSILTATEALTSNPNTTSDSPEMQQNAIKADQALISRKRFSMHSLLAEPRSRIKGR